MFCNLLDLNGDKKQVGSKADFFDYVALEFILARRMHNYEALIFSDGLDLPNPYATPMRPTTDT